MMQKKDIDGIFVKCDIKSQFDKINGKGFLEKQNGETQEVILKKIKDVINVTSKLKYNLFIKNKELRDYSKDFCFLLESAGKLRLWVDDFISNVEELLNDFLFMKTKYENILSEALKDKRRDITLSFNQEDSIHIIEENKLLRCQFEDVLSKSVLAHKNYVEDSSALLN